MSKTVVGVGAGVLGVGVIIVVALTLRHAPVNNNTNSSVNTNSANTAAVNTNAAVTAPTNQAAQPEQTETQPQTQPTRLSGTYRCWQFNLNGRILSTNSCRTYSPIVLNADGTYNISSEHGTYTISGDQITLSESKIRGVGTLKEGNMQIYFKYSYNGSDYETTYLLQEQ